MPAITTNKLHKHWNGVKAVHDLSVSIPEGRITGLIGPNGSGKTTLTNLLTGMFPFDEGTMCVGKNGELSRLAAHRVAGLGLTRTFQNVRLIEQMSVLDNLIVVLTSRNLFRSMVERDGKDRVKRAEEVLDMVGLLAKKNELAQNLSYGQRKLLEIGRALAMDSEVYLFDEPFAGLFPEMVKLVRAIMQGLRDSGKTIVLIEHDMPLIRSLAEYVIVMDEGKLLAEGEPDEVLRRPKVVEAYLGD